jgi:hypothetical protein
MTLCAPPAAASIRDPTLSDDRLADVDDRAGAAPTSSKCFPVPVIAIMRDAMRVLTGTGKHLAGGAAMSRILIYSTLTTDEALAGFASRRIGWFETETADYWEHPTRTDRVWLTPSGRWVWTAADLCEYLTVDEARQKLTEWGHGDAVAEHIDQPQPGRGRPEIGPEVKTRLRESVVDALDAMAAAQGISRAEQMRQIITDGVRAPS